MLDIVKNIYFIQTEDTSEMIIHIAYSFTPILLVHLYHAKKEPPDLTALYVVDVTEFESSAFLISNQTL